MVATADQRNAHAPLGPPPTTTTPRSASKHAPSAARGRVNVVTSGAASYNTPEAAARHAPRRRRSKTCTPAPVETSRWYGGAAVPWPRSSPTKAAAQPAGIGTRATGRAAALGAPSPAAALPATRGSQSETAAPVDAASSPSRAL